MPDTVVNRLLESIQKKQNLISKILTALSLTSRSPDEPGLLVLVVVMRGNISIRYSSTVALVFLSPQSLKLLRTSEFLPYVVFLQSPEFEVLKAMNTSAVEAGVVDKTLTVSDRCGRLWHVRS